jgi:hypothetical protein
MTTAYQSQPSYGRNSSRTLQTPAQAAVGKHNQSSVALAGGQGARDAVIPRLVGSHPGAVVASQATFSACVAGRDRLAVLVVQGSASPFRSHWRE